MTAIDWNDGRLITLEPGDTATCTALNQQQLYGLIFYNSAGNDTGATIMVNWSNSQPPARVQVPGTTGGQGLASILFVSGDDTTTVAASMLQNQPGAQVQCFLASVKMPVNTNGINNQPLRPDGQNHPFTAFTRYYAVPESHWYQVQVESTINQFISVLFTSQSAIVSVVNATVHPGTVVQGVGRAAQMYTLQVSQTQIDSYPIQGNGQQSVWVNADSVQNSQSAVISLQSLSKRQSSDSRQLIGTS
ncbi:MAG TPA: hypothetical protein VF070_00285 [Streptosporangiaceae bacterium]